MKKCALLGKQCTLYETPKLSHFWVHPAEILPFYGIIFKTLDKRINLNLSVDYWLFIY